eukprot:6207663-Pleurochrysis_carterae.AAC.3
MKKRREEAGLGGRSIARVAARVRTGKIYPEGLRKGGFDCAWARKGTNWGKNRIGKRYLGELRR